MKQSQKSGVESKYQILLLLEIYIVNYFKDLFILFNNHYILIITKKKKDAIQDAMGWTCSHLHLFRKFDPKYGKKINIGPKDVEFCEDLYEIDDTDAEISKYFSVMFIFF